MTTSRTFTVAVAAAVMLIVLAVGARTLFLPPTASEANPLHVGAPRTAAKGPDAYRGFLYGRVTEQGGASYQGRLRFGGDEEAFWGDQFNGVRDANPWAALVTAEDLTEQRPVEVLGVRIAHRERTIPLRRPFAARFGDLVRIEPDGRNIRLTLKSGAEVVLDRFSADDLADGIRVWDEEGGVVHLEERRIAAIAFQPTPPLRGAPGRLHGTVQTVHGEFTGFVQWNREQGVGADELAMNTVDGPVRVRLETIRSIVRRSPEDALVTLLDDRTFRVSGNRGFGRRNRGIRVDDARYGRVLVPWHAVERLDLNTGGSGPGYDDYPPGRPLAGSVTTRSGDRFVGRLVYDLDESETTEALDAPAAGLDYSIPFELIVSIAPPPPRDCTFRPVVLTLRSTEELHLDCAGDLDPGNGGMLILFDDGERSEYVPWPEVVLVDLD